MKKTKIRGIGIAAAACASLLVLSACAAEPTAEPNNTNSQGPKLESDMVVGFYGGVIGDAFSDVFVKGCSASLGVNITVEQDFDAPRLTKMKAGGSDIDVALFTDPIMPQAREAGLITPLPLAEIPNYSKVPDNFKSKDSVAVSMAVWGITYNSAKVSPAPTSWNDLLDAKYAGKVTSPTVTYNSSYLTLAAFEKMAGGDLVTNRAPGFDLMKQLRKNSSSFWSSSSDMMQQLQAGSVVMSSYASGSTAISASDPGGENIKFVAPKEGAYPVGFNMTISSKAKAPKAAAAFINCVLDAKNQSKWIDLYPSFPANTDAVISADTLKWLGGVKQVSDLVVVDWNEIAKVNADIVSTWQREIG